MISRSRLLTASLALALLCGPASAQICRPYVTQQPWCPAPTTIPGTSAPGAPGTPAAPGGEQPAVPGAPAPQLDTPPSTDAFTQAPSAGTPASGGYNPAQFGDLSSGPLVRVGATPSAHAVAPSTHAPASTALIPLVARGTFKIAENESPQPQDRVFFNYNYFNNLNLDNGTTGPNLNREVIGFEKTFLEGDASFGMRVPFLELSGSDGFGGSSTVGDLTFITKFALINNRETGNVLSTGLALTVPTSGPILLDGVNVNIRSTLFEPYIGYIFNVGDFYVSGFSSIVIPNLAEDATIVFNDVALGYWLYRDRSPDAVITGIVPTFEVHVTTPLNHRGLDNPSGLGVPDWVSLTGGVHVTTRRLEFGVAVGAPVTSPQPYTLEVLAHVNYHF